LGSRTPVTLIRECPQISPGCEDLLNRSVVIVFLFIQVDLFARLFRLLSTASKLARKSVKFFSSPLSYSIFAPTGTPKSTPSLRRARLKN
jgi:hypothetical protein